MHGSAPGTDRPVIVTERLTLRHPRRADLAAIVRIVGDWEVARRLSRVPHPYGPADAIFFLEQVVPGEWVWSVTLHGFDELVGVVGLTPGAQADTAELGYWLARAHWGRGIMTEAALAIVAYGFETLRLSRITSGHFTDNPASGRVLDKLGFVETGRAVRPCPAAGSDLPSVQLSLVPA